jgi:predicted RNase H-like HicB family nuclease/DNA-binding XRE family transcriptional regulator
MSISGLKTKRSIPKMKRYIFPAIFKKSGESAYVVHFPDLKGCVAEGDTIEQAFNNAQAALTAHLDGMRSIPSPSKIDSLTQTENSIVMLVEDGTPNNTVYFKQNDFLQFFENALKKKGFTRYQIAKSLDIDKAHIGRIAKGNRSPSVKLAKRIAALLEIDWRVFYQVRFASAAGGAVDARRAAGADAPTDDLQK